MSRRNDIHERRESAAGTRLRRRFGISLSRYYYYRYNRRYYYRYGFVILRLFIVPPRRPRKDRTRQTPNGVWQGCVFISKSHLPVGRPLLFGALRPKRLCRRKRRGRDLNLNRAGRRDTRAGKRTTTKTENHHYSLPRRSHPWNGRRPTPFPWIASESDRRRVNRTTRTRLHTNIAMQILGGLIIHKGN